MNYFVVVEAQKNSVYYFMFYVSNLTHTKNDHDNKLFSSLLLIYLSIFFNWILKCGPFN